MPTRNSQPPIEEFSEMDFRPGASEILPYRLDEKSPFPGGTITNLETFPDIVAQPSVLSTEPRHDRLRAGILPFAASL